MQYIEYVQTDGACWFDTGLIPDDSTRFEIVEFTPLAKATNWQVYIGRSYTDMDGNTCMVFKANSNGNAYESKFGSCERVGSPSYSTGVTVNVKYSMSGLSIDNVFYSFSSGQGLQRADSHTIWIAAENNSNSWPTHRASNAKFGEIKFWTQEVLVADLVPAQSGNSIGFYDKVSNIFRPNLGTGTPIAGPVTSSIKVEPSIKVVGFASETFSASVQTENYWVASVADGSWLSIDAESGTGNTVINITVDDNYDTSARTDTITFVDMTTTDEAVLSIRQKKYTDGQPMYLGEDTIYEFYLGGDPISEMYLGEVLVYSSGPFVGLKTSPKRVGFTKNDLSATLKIKSSESWSLTAPAWVTASPTTGDTGETVVTLTTTVQTADTSSTISIVSSSFSASVEVSYKNYVNPVADNEMWYTSLNNVVVPPYRTPAQFTSSSQSSQGLQQSIISNAYDQDKGCNVIVWGLDLEMTPGSGFYRKTELVDVKYGNKLTLEGPENFTGCTNLTAITYGESEELELNEGAWPPNLQAVYCHCKTEPREGAYDARGNFGRFCTKAGVFHYPQGKNWSTFISKLPSGWTAVDDL